MSRLRRIADRDRIFFVTTNLAPGVADLTSAERNLVVAQLERQHLRHDFLLFGYVVMPSHLHLLLAPDRLGLIEVMRWLKRMTAQEIGAHRNKSGVI